jgi:hypothetical protein
MQKAKTDKLVLDIRQYHMILDTKAYILALRARLEDQTKRRERLEEAKKIFVESLQREDEPLSPLLVAERSYHYALTLDYLGESSEADKYYKISDDAGYRPTHELLLMPRPERLGPR